MAQTSWDIKGKFALVTGAGSGINHAFAEKLLEAGCSAVFADLTLRSEAEDTIVWFPHPTPKEDAPLAVFHKMDQSDWPQISETWEFALKTFGRVDLVCPGAGIWEPPSSGFWYPPGISPLSQDDPNGRPGVHHLRTVNLAGPICLAQIAIAHWLQSKTAGNMLFVSSLSAYVPIAGTALYNASKGGLVSFTQSLGQMRSRLGIRVAAVCPATTFTPAVLQEYCRGKVREQDMNMTPAECAGVMLRIVTDAEFGDGQVVEAMQFGTKERSDVRVRVVPYDKLMPDVDLEGDFSGKNVLVEDEKMWRRLQERGMSP